LVAAGHSSAHCGIAEMTSAVGGSAQRKLRQGMRYRAMVTYIGKFLPERGAFTLFDCWIYGVHSWIVGRGGAFL
jgi:hypothetical protein